jgi:hypothetical protein
MGKINVVREDGSVVSVDEKDYELARNRTGGAEAETAFDQTHREEREVRRKSNSDAAGKVGTLLVSAADTASAGILGKVVNAISPSTGQHMRESMQDNPGMATAGSLIGVMAPGIGTLAGGAKKALGSGLAGYAAEGGIIGLGTHIAHSNITGDPITIEGLAEDIGLGGAMNLGFGIVAKSLRGAGKLVKGETLPKGDLNFEAVTEGASKTPLAKAARARQEADEAIAAVGEEANAKAAVEKIAAKKEAAKVAAAQLREAAAQVDELPGYGALRDAHNSYRGAVRAANKVVVAEETAWKEFASPEGVKATNRAYEKVQNALRAKRGEMGGEWAGRPIRQISEAKEVARAAAAAGDFQAARAAYNGLDESIAEFIPDFPAVELPLPPSGKLAEVPGELPRKLTDLGRKHPESIAKLANAGMDEGTAAQLDALAGELGLAPGESAGETLSAIQKHMRDTFYKAGKAGEDIPFERLDDVIEKEHGGLEPGKWGDREVVPGKSETLKEEWKAASAEVDAARSTGEYAESKWTSGGSGKPAATAPKGIMAKGAWMAKKAAVYSAARMADVGGPLGALYRVVAGEAAHASMDAVEGWVAGGAVASKAGLRSKIGAVLDKFGKPAANALDEIGPAISSLRYSFPYGTDDPEPDERKLTLNRMKDIEAAGVQAPDALYTVVKNIMGTSGDVAAKLHAQWLLGLQYLNARAPKDPGINVTMDGSKWLPDRKDAREYSHRYSAVMNPTAYLALTLAGGGTIEGMDALSAVWPAAVEHARGEALLRDWSGMTAKAHNGLSMLFGRPVSALQDPDVFFQLQGSQMQSALPPTNAGPTQGGTPGFGKPGRPAAYDSQPAGSSVAGLTNRN